MHFTQSLCSQLAVVPLLSQIGDPSSISNQQTNPSPTSEGGASAIPVTGLPLLSSAGATTLCTGLPLLFTAGATILCTGLPLLFTAGATILCTELPLLPLWVEPPFSALQYWSHHTLYWTARSALSGLPSSRRYPSVRTGHFGGVESVLTRRPWSPRGLPSSRLFPCQEWPLRRGGALLTRWPWSPRGLPSFRRPPLSGVATLAGWSSADTAAVESTRPAIFLSFLPLPPPLWILRCGWFMPPAQLPGGFPTVRGKVLRMYTAPPPFFFLFSPPPSPSPRSLLLPFLGWAYLSRYGVGVGVGSVVVVNL
jgi:hypothetical protein